MKKNEVNVLVNRMENSFKGVEIPMVPKVGGGWSHDVGSDSYGGAIAYVSPDLSWFVCDNGDIAKLETRKNAIHYGTYINAYPKDSNLHNTLLANGDYEGIYKNLKTQKTCHCVRCTSHNVRWVHEKPQTTYLDPSF